ncbi:hypothetical protein ACQY0O_006250 [Thecaphora frezii]
MPNAPRPVPFDTAVEHSYSIHLSLFTGKRPAPSIHHNPDSCRLSLDHALGFDDLFAPLPDNAPALLPSASAIRPYKKIAAAYDLSPESIDKRFGPIRIDWADRIGTGATAAMAEPSSSQDASQPAAGSSMPPKKTRKRVFHSAKPQVSAPVAVFEKQDSFKVEDGSRRKQREGSSAARREEFQGMEIGATEVAFGIVHLFKDKQDATKARDPDHKGENQLAATATGDENQLDDDEVGSIVAVLAVPSYLTAADFLSFVEPASEAICHLRMIRDVHPNRCMVLVKFRDASDAEDFHKMFNGQPFNAMDPEEVCQVVYVTSVTVSKQSTLPLTYPMLSNSDPWPLRSRPSSSGGSGSGGATTEGASGSSGYELPTCPVCLERMDSSVTGLMTISCQHTFHCSCLSKWGEGRCPVCRYSQAGNRKGASSRASRRYSARATATGALDPRQAANGDAGATEADEDDEDEDEDVEPSLCTICKTNQDLWVCLICASVGCGRYKAGHAHKHFEETGHLYSLELETQRVWDYAGDGYVHRLLQNKADGKLVELPSASSVAATPDRLRRLPASTLRQDQSSGSREAPQCGAQASGADGDDTDVLEGASSAYAASEKIEAIGLEYSYLLTSQLESQRHFYEEKMETIQAQLDSMVSKVQQLEPLASQLDEVSQRAQRLEAEKEELQREKAKSDKRADKMLELARKFEGEMQSERSLSEGLMRKLEKQRESETSLRAEVQDLQEQVKDLMFFLQARDKVEQEGGEDLRGGDLEVKPSATASSKKKKGKKKS